MDAYFFPYDESQEPLSSDQALSAVALGLLVSRWPSQPAGIKLSGPERLIREWMRLEGYTRPEDLEEIHCRPDWAS